jgi:hypothetical protein
VAFLFLPVLWSADGKRVFLARCAGCHGADARGSGKGPGLADNPRLSGQSAKHLASVVKLGFPASGMPAMDLPPEDLDAVTRYVSSLNGSVPPGTSPATRRITWGTPQPGDWLTYNGKLSANRYSELKQINTATVARLHLEWIFRSLILVWKLRHSKPTA